MEDAELRSRFHRAYDEIAAPAPWLQTAVGESLRRRRATPARAGRPAWIMAAVAVLLVVAIAVAVIAGSRALQRPVVPGTHGSAWCAGVGSQPPHEASVPVSASPLPAAVPPGFQAECSANEASSDSPVALATYFDRTLTDNGWSVNTNGPIQGFVITTWTPDAKVTGGPHPGYKPAFTGLTGDDVTSATAVLDASGTSWVVNAQLTARGAALFADLTRANVAACPGDPSTNPSTACAERFLSMWVRLTQDDIDHWEDFAYANGVSAPFDGNGGPQNAYPALIEDAITLQPVTGGEFQIAPNTRESADYIAEGFNTHLFGTHVQMTFTKGHSFGVIDLVPAGNVTVIWVRVVS